MFEKQYQYQWYIMKHITFIWYFAVGNLKQKKNVIIYDWQLFKLSLHAHNNIILQKT